jgi:thioester reductase-like protein
LSIKRLDNILPDAPGPYLENLLDPVGALPAGGYTRSKWCAEQILARAAVRTAVKISIVRVVQVCGGKGGYWNTSEWFPLLIKTSINLNALPSMPILKVSSGILPFVRFAHHCQIACSVGAVRFGSEGFTGPDLC